ncbi:MAG: hypothetical protein WAV20_08360 [Blastocatellia bacterium]
MNSVICVLFILAAWAPATAKQETSQPDSPTPKQTEQAPSAPPAFSAAGEVPQTRTPAEDRARFERQHPSFVILPPQWVLKEGALYLDVLGNGTLIPVPGGGASGCFGVNSTSRFDPFKPNIEVFPPKPPSVPPRR